jgi:catechol 2,3-dioxygenase-like lactoylglutathione lyase family enzyme
MPRSANVGPTALHHHAYVCADQERTRRFYEEIVGLPLVAFWIEEEVFEGETHNLSHAFYGLRDGGSLAFFSLADPDQQARHTAKHQSVFMHLALRTDKATQDEIRRRLQAVGIEPMEVDHGYTHSIYAHDPDGLLLEFSVDPEGADETNRWQRAKAHSFLDEWVAGRRTPNNTIRHGE